jgi:hypothetical protein
MQRGELAYHIFSGRFPDTNILWRESVVGLAAARERMAVFAAQEPGPYFVFCSYSQAVLAITDTTPARRVNEGAESHRAITVRG